MNAQTGPGYTEPITEPGWVDALCTCGNAAAHPGLFCPNRELPPQLQPNYKRNPLDDIPDGSPEEAS